MDHLFVGLDVAKDRLDVHERPVGETFSVSHDEPGLTALVDRLRSRAPTHRLGSDGGYEATVAATLASAGLPVAVVNPPAPDPGLCPRHQPAGQDRHARCARHRPVCRGHPPYHRRRTTGHPGKVALTAAMRKLLTILNAILRDRRPWQPA
jgi:transposase